MEKSKITIKAAMNADTQKVWDYYTQPQHITQWNFAADTWCCPSAENDLRVGGKMKSRMEAKDGSFGFDFEAIYNEVLAPQKLVYTMPDGREVAIGFDDQGDTTNMTIVFDAENENPIEMQQGGWQAILNNFKAYLEAN